MWLGEKLVIRFFSLVKNIVWLIRRLIPFFSQVRKFVSVFPAFRGGHASNLYLCHWRENRRVALLRFFHNVSRLQQGLLMLALSKILFFNTRINQLFKKQKEMSSFYSHFWKKKTKKKWRKRSGKHSGGRSEHLHQWVYYCNGTTTTVEKIEMHWRQSRKVKNSKTFLFFIRFCET